MKDFLLKPIYNLKEEFQPASMPHKAMILLFIGMCVLCGCNDRKAIANENGSVAYYIDSEHGNDANTGCSEDSPWQSLDKIEQTALNPGDIIRFKRGSKFTGPLTIKYSGNSEKPISLTDYGDSRSPAPAFTNPVFDPENNNFGNCIRLKGSFIIVENLFFHHTVAQLPESTGSFTTMWELGAIYVDKTASYSLIRNNEIFDCGVGIKSYGPHTVIANNYIHDCNRVLKKWSWGPIGIWLGGDDQEVKYNKIFNYKAIDPRITWGPDSYGGGADGSAIEIDDARVDKNNISIHHNYTRDCQGFLEVTWSDVRQNPDYRNFEIHHNISDDYQQFVALWRGANFKIENNTIIRRKINANDWGVFNITQNNGRNVIRNNIIIVEQNIPIFNLGRNGNARPQSIIENNLYYAVSGSLVMGLEGPGKEPIFGDPLLVNYSEGNDPLDFSITSESPAIDKGVPLGYKADFINSGIPKHNLPDLGAFEFQN